MLGAGIAVIGALVIVGTRSTCSRGDIRESLEAVAAVILENP